MKAVGFGEKWITYLFRVISDSGESCIRTTKAITPSVR